MTRLISQELTDAFEGWSRAELCEEVRKLRVLNDVFEKRANEAAAHMVKLDMAFASELHDNNLLAGKAFFMTERPARDSQSPCFATLEDAQRILPFQAIVEVAPIAVHAPAKQRSQSSLPNKWHHSLVANFDGSVEQFYLPFPTVAPSLDYHYRLTTGAMGGPPGVYPLVIPDSKHLYGMTIAVPIGFVGVVRVEVWE